MAHPISDGQLETASEMAEALRAGQVTSVDLVERALRRAEAWQTSTNAFSQLWADQAMKEARRIDAIPPGERPEFAGVPLAVKDLYDVAGEETTGCCAAYRGAIARRDAPVIERIRQAGLVMVGKTNQHELAAGGTNLVSACGRTGNPWDPERMTGGSSGGSAAAVAAGVVPWALGSDTGGSIRIPCSMCGILGLKPTFGRIPTEGLMPLAPSMDCPGPMASTLDDLLALYHVMAGGLRAEEPLAVDGDPAPAVSAEGLRVGVPDGFFVDRVHDETLAAVHSAAAGLEAAGATLSRVDGGGLDEVRPLWMSVCGAEFADAHPLLRDPERRELVHPSVRAWLDLGESQTDPLRARAREERERVERWFRQRLRDLDALLIPTTPYPAPRADQETVDLGRARTVDVTYVGPGWITCSVNLAGLPSINLPAGRSSEGMPIGVSLVAPAGAEATLQRLAVGWAAAVAYEPERPSFQGVAPPPA
jgi:aspartyl-tRNA(Asn)/glutamyl-tRNA(Gln) amidotransferase subunit A